MTVRSGERLAAADIVVIGAGIMGASIACQLAKRSDRRVVVVDERPPVGGMSGRTFGQIRQHYSNALMVEMAIRGFEVLNDWQAEVGVGDPGYVRLGYLLLVVEAQVAACRRNVELGRQLGVDTRFASPDEIAAHRACARHWRPRRRRLGTQWRLYRRDPHGAELAGRGTGGRRRAAFGAAGGRDRHAGRPRRGRGDE